MKRRNASLSQFPLSSKSIKKSNTNQNGRDAKWEPDENG
jgi:hypothetical protein